MPHNSVVISSGHGKYVRGASGYIDEVDEARRLVECVAKYLRSVDVMVETFHDDVSTTQDENLRRIVDFHNSKQRSLDVSVHFNAYEDTHKAMGTECLFVSQIDLAEEMSAAIADAGHLLDRGPKQRSDLYFLNNTEEPAILIETCFVDSTADVELYQQNFDDICRSIAGVIGGETIPAYEPPAEIEEEPPREPIQVTLTISANGPVKIEIIDET